MPTLQQRTAKVIRTLVPLWDQHHARNLRLYYRTGRQLNKLFLPKPPHGAGLQIMKRVQRQLRCSRALIYRMREFAIRYPELAEFERRHPNSTWSDVCRIMVLPPGSVVPRRASAVWMRKKLATLTRRVQRWTPTPVANISEIRVELNALLIALSEAVGISLVARVK